MSASIRATEASRTGLLGCRRGSAGKMHHARGRQGAAERARYRRQRHHGRQRRQPPLAEHSLRLLGFHFRLDALAVPVALAGRHDHDLARGARRVGLGGIGFAWELRAWEFRPWLRLPWGRRPAREPDREISTSAAACGVCCAAIGSLAASDELETAGPALTDPVSPLVGSACCSLTFKFSSKGSPFGNFHSLRNRYRRRPYQNFRKSPGRFFVASPVHVALRHRPGASRCLVSRRLVSGLTWRQRPARRRRLHGHRKMHQRIRCG